MGEVVDGGCLVGGGSLAPRDEKATPPVSYQVLKTREPTNCSSRTRILLYVLLLLSRAGGWVVDEWWVHGGVSGGVVS